MTYFGILVSSCKVMIEVPDCRLLVVEDRQLGTNDCRGWISRSLLRKLQQKHQAELLAKEVERLFTQQMANRTAEEQELVLSEEEEATLVTEAKRRIQGKAIGSHRFYQFRLAFDHTQAKGSFKVMADEVAEKLEADIILPKSCVKPKYQGGVLDQIKTEAFDNSKVMDHLRAREVHRAREAPRPVAP